VFARATPNGTFQAPEEGHQSLTIPTVASYNCSRQIASLELIPESTALDVAALYCSALTSFSAAARNSGP